MTAASTTGPRTYGGWRLARRLGLGDLGLPGTFALLGAVTAAILAFNISLRAGMVASVPAAATVALLLLRVDGMPLAQLGVRYVRWGQARMQGWHQYRGGVVVDHPAALDLPGPLACTQLLEVEDGRGGTFGVVWDRRTGRLTATLRVAASSTWLVEPSEADGWVANWHAWLASLGYDPMIAWLAVTVSSAPEPGTALADHLLGSIDPDAPVDAQRFVRLLMEQSPGAAADVDTLVSVTFDPSRSPEQLKELTDQCAEVSRQLYGLESGLAACGVTVLGRASAPQLAGFVRVAYDPDARGEVDRALVADDPHGLLDWAEAGPTAAEELWDHYQHEGGWSVTFGWREAPRQRVTSDVLSRLVGPSRWPKRVTLLFRPLAAGDAARALEAQVNAAAFRDHLRARQGRDATARDRADQQQALQAAREEAEGAGVVLLSLYATVTVTDREELSSAVADVAARADHSKLRIRRLYGSQAAGFAVTLPTGVHPTELATRGRR